jgi:hypothetical protein
MFGKKERIEVKFETRAEAFAYMLAYQVEQGVGPMEAAERADVFASIFAKNMGIPDKVEPKKEGIERYIHSIDKVVTYCDEHPKAVDMVVGVATFLVGTLTGKKAEQVADAAPVAEPIDFDKID